MLRLQILTPLDRRRFYIPPLRFGCGESARQLLSVVESYKIKGTVSHYKLGFKGEINPIDGLD